MIPLYNGLNNLLSRNELKNAALKSDVYALSKGV